MKFLIDLVHHNPGEAPFESRFSNANDLTRLGYTGQVFKHLNCAIRFDTLGRDDFPAGTPEGLWMQGFRQTLAREIREAKQSALKVFYHVDLFVLPRQLVHDEQAEICTPDGRITLDSERTLEIHRALFAEMFRDFPEVDGLIVRIGETYLFDTPYHCGNTAVPLHGKEVDPAWSQRQYANLLRFLREEICIRHERILIQRTWDIYNDRFHANPSFYLGVTGNVPPHPKLVFSIKHTALDFFRRVKVNPALGIGQHSQIIEIQCQREYEGKGAFPNYIGHLIAAGLPENTNPLGLSTLLQMPNIQGVFTWSRGGGWFGPYLKNEFWCGLNVEIITSIARDPLRREPEIFADYCRTTLGMDDASGSAFRNACLLGAEALLAGRYCEAYDAQWQQATIPTELWMRDDRLGGMDQLRPVFQYLHEHGMTAEALEEKWTSVRLWKEALGEFEKVVMRDPSLKEIVETSFRYGTLLFEIIALGWEILSHDFAANSGYSIDPAKLRKLHSRYLTAWQDYRKLGASAPGCATLFKGNFWNWPGKPALPGLDASVSAAIDRLDGSAPVDIPFPALEKTWFGMGVDGAR